MRLFDVCHRPALWLQGGTSRLRNRLSGCRMSGWAGDEWEGWGSPGDPGGGWMKRSWSSSAGGGLTPSHPPRTRGRPSHPGTAGGLTPSGSKQQEKQKQKHGPCEEVFYLLLPFSMKNMCTRADRPSWVKAAQEDADRFGCRISWRAARRVPLLNPSEKVPYIVTVVGAMGGVVLHTLQDDIYKNWPLTEGPPPMTKIQSDAVPFEDTGDLGGHSVYSFEVPGRPPVDVRMFASHKCLAPARQNKPGGIKGPRIRSSGLPGRKTKKDPPSNTHTHHNVPIPLDLYHTNVIAFRTRPQLPSPPPAVA